MSLSDDRRQWTFHRTRRAGVVCLSPVLLCIIAVAVIGMGSTYLKQADCPVCPHCEPEGVRAFSDQLPVDRLKLLENDKGLNAIIGNADLSSQSLLSGHPTAQSLDGNPSEGPPAGKDGPAAGTAGHGAGSTGSSALLDPQTADSVGPSETNGGSLEVESAVAGKVETEHELNEESPPPLIIAVTPTHARAAQAFHMTQVVNILRVVPPPVLWVVVESLRKTDETAKLLNKTAGRCLRVGAAKECSKVDYVHLSTGLQPEDTHVSRGVRQRNSALDYIESNRIKGLVYFMDDDNAYSPELFEEFRKIKRVGVLPVGLMWTADYQKLVPWRQADPFVERALVRLNDKEEPEVYGWETFEWSLRAPPGTGRKFHTDMAGFAFNSELLWEPTSNITGRPKHPVRFKAKSAWLETNFLDRLIPRDTYLEPLADMCQDVWVWHVKFESKLYMPYPDNVWRIPQPDPKDLVQDQKPVPVISRYIRNGYRFKLKNYNKNIPFGYKKNNPPKEKKKSPSKSSKPKTSR